MLSVFPSTSGLRSALVLAVFALMSIGVCVPWAHADGVNERVLAPSPFVAPAPLAQARRVSRDEVAREALDANLNVREARLNVDRARYEQLRALGRNDGQFTSELAANRSTTPINSGISRGISRSDGLRLDTSLSRRFDTGTSLALRMENGYARSEFPLFIGGVASETIVSGPDYQNSLTASITQSLLAGRSRAAARSSDIAAELQLRMAQAQLRRAEETAVHEAMTAYEQVWTAEVALQVQRRSLRRTQRQVDAAEARVRAGQIAPYERNLLLQRLSVNQEGVLAAHTELRRQSRRLMQAVQAAPGANFLLAKDAERFAAAARATSDIADESEDATLALIAVSVERREGRYTSDQWCEVAARHNSELDVAAAQIALAESSLLPIDERRKTTLDLSLGVTSTGLDPDFLKSLERMATMDALTWFGSLKFAANFRQRGVRGELGAAHADVERAQVASQRLVDTVCFAVTDAYEALELQRARFALASWRIAVAVEGLQAEDARFERGLTTVPQMLDALENVETAELDQVRAYVDAEVAWWTLLLQVGAVVDESGARR